MIENGGQESLREKTTDSSKEIEVFPGVMERRYFLGSSIT